MSEQDEFVRKIAERITRRVSTAPVISSAQGRWKGSQRFSSPDSDRDHTITAELSAVQGALSDLQKKIARLETRITSGEDHHRREEAPPVFPRSNESTAAPFMHSPWLSGVYFSSADHASQEKFGVKEATVSELVDFFENEKTCSLEPGNKPCDHCSMCNSRGF